MGKRNRTYIKEYYLIGRLLKRVHPELAAEIVDTYIRPEPVFNDFSRIPQLFDAFCKIKGLTPDKVQGSLFKTCIVDHRRLFVSTMIRLYNPQIHHHPQDAMLLRWGFNSFLATFLNIPKHIMTKTIRDCVTQEKIYDQVRAEVDDMVQQILKIAG